MAAQHSPEEIKKAHEILYAEGIRIREQVAGKAFVEKSLNNAKGNPFATALQEYVTEGAWGSVWTRPGLELKVRSFLVIAMLACQNRGTELATHVKGGLNNGATQEEIREVLLQAAAYNGAPTAVEGFRVAWKAIEEWNEEQKAKAN
ncbi:protocatechuate 3,4-dioxygenase, P3,4O [Dissoconium aciculare CBS 342.82]|uniref:Protocatechuate 3,4-dioxygenase, P3,4O n=1 Tax=Dissoconium aciculare CBS 342.82 TaxID=1314786 RepID=A0A6J3M5M2_9PEZI|nr:protocatechuate 3,4-dioxygenase, P3,4O [Dissoconium aciculare CBS 342.82]KAF1823345.1 protocatechuate 3,4-dioxygenase, P3,4O [Dissoconium aciculare CBS 342.82]